MTTLLGLKQLPVLLVAGSRSLAEVKARKRWDEKVLEERLGATVIVPVDDPDSSSREEIIEAYLEMGFGREDAEAFTSILKDPVGKGVKLE